MTAEAQIAAKSAPTALCPSCKSPLICTFAWERYEFYCINCGGHYGWLDPERGDPGDAEVDRRYEELFEQWKNLGGENLIGGGIMLTTCATCAKKREPHMHHATVDEIAAHGAALGALASRARQGGGA